MAAEFQGRRVLVTGGARGLGRACVEAFLKLGAEVIVIDREAELLDQLKKELNVKTVTLDLSDWNATRAAVEKIGPVHHLVNNAGIGGGTPLTGLTEADVDRVFSINFKALINVSDVVVKSMPEGGTIVNVSSIFGTNAYQAAPMYSCSKAAVMMLTKCQAIEYGEKKIRVNCVRPSFMATAIFGPPEAIAFFEKRAIPGQIIKEATQTSDTAELILFLSSSKSRMITGEDIVIDGGATINHFANRTVHGMNIP